MGTPATSARIVRFGIFEVDLNALELRKHGLRLKLPEQPFQILALLLERPGEIITRDELRNRLWQTDTFVDFDHGLNNAVMRLREVLGDSSDNPRFVETIPRRGYRFIAHVDEFFPATPAAVVHELAADQIVVGTPASPSATAPRLGNSLLLTQRRIAVGILGLLVILGGGVIAARYFATRNPNSVLAGKQTTSLVVLPLENLSGD